MIILFVLPLVLRCVGTRADLCLDGDFDSQVQAVLHTAALSPEDDQVRRLRHDVETTMQRRWPGTEMLPFGSLASGVALKTSDADYYVKIPGFNTSAESYVIQEATKLLQHQPDLFSGLTTDFGRTTVAARVTFLHKPTARDCDVVFMKDIVYIGSTLTRYYFNLNEIFKPLVLIIKFWSQVQPVKKDTNMKSYHLYLLTIFYLQQKQIVPPVSVLQSKDRHFKGIWDMSFNEIAYNTTNTDSLYQLLGGFFTYYSEFNFKEYIVSPYAGRPIRKSDFLSITRVPETFYLYKENVQDLGVSPLDVSPSICIQNEFEHNRSAMPRVTRAQAAGFVSHVRAAATMFRDLPPEAFLKALFTNLQDNVQLTESELNSCINVTDV